VPVGGGARRLRAAPARWPPPALTPQLCFPGPVLPLEEPLESGRHSQGTAREPETSRRRRIIVGRARFVARAALKRVARMAQQSRRAAMTMAARMEPSLLASLGASNSAMDKQ